MVPDYCSPLTDHSFLGKMANFRANIGKVQDESDTSTCVRQKVRKCSRMMVDGVKSKCMGATLKEILFAKSETV